MPRALIVAAGFLLAGLFGVAAYFVPVLQTASSSVSPGALPNLDPRPASTAPFTVLLLGSDDDSKFPPDRLNTQSMILLRIEQGAGRPGAALTDLAADCLQPAMSPDETMLAMVCTNGDPQSTQLAVAAFSPVEHSLGSPTMLAGGSLAASPTFSPDGKTIAYLAPASKGGGFQLWTVPAGAQPGAHPRQITSELALDAASAPIWVG